MYIVIYAILLVLTIMIGKTIYRTILNPISIWGSLWSFIGVMSNIALFDYFKPTDYVNNIIIVGIIVYTCYCSLYGWNKRYLAFETTDQSSMIFGFQYKVFWIINILAILYESQYFIKAINVLLSHGFQLVYLRGVLTDSTEGIISGGIASIIRDSGVKNVFTLTALYAAVLIFSGKLDKRKRKVVYLAIIETFEYCIANAARAYLVNFVFFILFALLFMKKDSLLSMIKKNKRIVGIGVILFVFLLIIQNSRASDMSILKTIYMYYCSGPSYLSRLLEDTSTAICINSDFYWGTVTLGFISNIFYYLQIALTGINNSTVKLIASTITIKQYFVGQSTNLNAMCTCFYAFLADWGTIGAVIGPIISAIITCRYFRKMKLRKNLGSMAICIYVFYLMFRTVFKWDLLYIDFTVILILNYFICPVPGQRFVIFPVNWSEYDVSKD